MHTHTLTLTLTLTLTHTHTHTHTYTHTLTHIHTHTYIHIHTHTHTHTQKIAPLFQKPLIKGHLLVKKFRSQLISDQLFSSFTVTFTLSGQFFDLVPISSVTAKRRKKPIGFLGSELYVESLSVEHQWWLHQVLYCGNCLYQLPH